jgi:hypothetical protein
LTREDARALELPAACPEDVTEALMRVHGFTIPLKLASGGMVRVMPVRVNGLEFARLRNLGCRPRGAHGTEALSHRQGFRHEPENRGGRAMSDVVVLPGRRDTPELRVFEQLWRNS